MTSAGGGLNVNEGTTTVGILALNGSFTKNNNALPITTVNLVGGPRTMDLNGDPTTVTTLNLQNYTLTKAGTGVLDITGAVYPDTSANGTSGSGSLTLNAGTTSIANTATATVNNNDVNNSAVLNVNGALNVTTQMTIATGGKVNLTTSGASLTAATIVNPTADTTFAFTGGTLTVGTFTGDLVQKGGILETAWNAARTATGTYGITAVDGSYTLTGAGMGEIVLDINFSAINGTNFAAPSVGDNRNAALAGIAFDQINVSNVMNFGTLNTDSLLTLNFSGTPGITASTSSLTPGQTYTFTYPLMTFASTDLSGLTLATSGVTTTGTLPAGVTLSSDATGVYLIYTVTATGGGLAGDHYSTAPGNWSDMPWNTGYNAGSGTTGDTSGFDVFIGHAVNVNASAAANSITIQKNGTTSTGALTIDNNFELDVATDVLVESGTTLAVNSAGDGTSGSVGLKVVGTLTNDGTTSIADGKTAKAGRFLGTGTLELGGALELTGSSASTIAELSVTGTNALLKNNDGTLTVTEAGFAADANVLTLDGKGITITKLNLACTTELESSATGSVNFGEINAEGTDCVIRNLSPTYKLLVETLNLPDTKKLTVEGVGDTDTTALNLGGELVMGGTGDLTIADMTSTGGTMTLNDGTTKVTGTLTLDGDFTKTGNALDIGSVNMGTIPADRTMDLAGDDTTVTTFALGGKTLTRSGGTGVLDMGNVTGGGNLDLRAGTTKVSTAGQVDNVRLAGGGMVYGSAGVSNIASNTSVTAVGTTGNSLQLLGTDFTLKTITLGEKVGSSPWSAGNLALSGTGAADLTISNLVGRGSITGGGQITVADTLDFLLSGAYSSTVPFISFDGDFVLNSTVKLDFPTFGEPGVPWDYLLLTAGGLLDGSFDPLDEFVFALGSDPGDLSSYFGGGIPVFASTAMSGWAGGFEIYAAELPSGLYGLGIRGHGNPGDVPEPATWLLLILGVLGGGGGIGMRRYRSKMLAA